MCVCVCVGVWVCLIFSLVMLYTSGVHSSYVMRIVLSCSEGSKGRQASAVNPEGLELYCDDDISLKERLQRAEVVSSLITLRCVCLQNL